MNLTRDRLHSIGWISLLTLCLALTAALTLRVNAVKSEVHQAEGRIVKMRKQMNFLETEYETRSNQHQLKALNDIEFGYSAPRAQQYLEGERQLAVLGLPRAPGAPAMIRVADASTDENAPAYPPMVSPITGARAGEAAGRADHAAVPGTRAEVPANEVDPVGAAISAQSLGARLTRIGPASGQSQ